MIYFLIVIIFLGILGFLFREEFRSETSEYLAMVCLGAIFWPVMIILFVFMFLKWRKNE